MVIVQTVMNGKNAKVIIKQVTSHVKSEVKEVNVMYKPEREYYYRHLLSIYSRYIPKLVIGRYKGALIFIDTDNRIYYNLEGQAIGQFCH